MYLRALSRIAVAILTAVVGVGAGEALAQSYRGAAQSWYCPLPNQAPTIGVPSAEPAPESVSPPGTGVRGRSAAAAAAAARATLPNTGTDSAGIGLRLDPALSESGPRPGEQVPIFVSADRMSGRLGEQTVLTGNAQLRKAGTVVNAEQMTYHEDTDELFAEGDVRIAREGSVFSGPELRLRLDTSEGEFRSPTYSLSRYQGGGEADKLEFLGPQRLRLSNATYTTCTGDDPDWILKAGTLNVDQNAEEGKGRSARLYFKGIPILATPYFEFPIGDQRRSGLLPPSFSVSSQSGLEFVLPYYWNLAPNRDVTFYPGLLARRGFQLGTQYRYLAPSHYGEARLDWTPNDANTGTSRYFLNSRHTITDLNGWTGGWVVKGVSDDRYFIDYSRSILVSSERSLPRDLYLARTYGDWSALVRSSSWQNILDAVAAPPYDRIPQLQLRHRRRDLNGFDIDGLYDATWFTRPLAGSTEGLRLVANPGLSYPIRRPEGFLVPRVGIHLGAYWLDDNAAVAQRTIQSAVPTFSIDSGLVFERNARYLGRNFRQTMEPRLYYVRTPYRDQSEIPVFDTGVADFNFAELFTPNSFVGSDRVADANQLTAALVSRMIDPESGNEALRLAIGQRFYFSDQLVSIPGVALRTDARSDLLFGAAGDLGVRTSIDGELQYSLGDSQLQRLSVNWRYTPGEQRVLNAGVRYLRSEIGQLDLSWQWPLSPAWRTMGRVSYSWLDQRVDVATSQLVPARAGVVESVLGVEYHACCWATRFVVQRFVTAEQTTTSAFFIQLELKGVARIGSDPFDILRRSIPGYQLPTDRLEAPSRYYGYE